MKKCVIILNPESGKKRKITTYQDFYDICRKHGYDAEVIVTKSKGDAERIIQCIDKRTDLVISAGGDGTLNEIVTGNLKRDKPLVLAPLPLGSTNDVGSMYGLEYDPFKNLEMILMGKSKKADICYINESPFVYVACIGDYIDMAYSTPRSLKKRYGKIAYILYGIKRLRNKIRKYDIQYKVNGETHVGRYSYIFISNSSRIAGQPDVYYDVKLDDKMFEVAFVPIKSRKEMLKFLVLASNMDVKDIPGITYYQTNEIDIEFLDEPKTSWCIDGEEYKSEERVFHFNVNQNMKMQVPTESVKKLFNEQ